MQGKETYGSDTARLFAERAGLADQSQLADQPQSGIRLAESGGKADDLGVRARR